MQTIDLTENDILAVLDRAQQVMDKYKKRIIIYYSPERDRLVATLPGGLTKAMRAQLESRPKLMAGEYKGKVTAKVRQDVRSLVKRMNGRPSEKSQKSRASNREAAHRAWAGRLVGKLNYKRHKKHIFCMPDDKWFAANYPITAKLTGAPHG